MKLYSLLLAIAAFFGTIRIFGLSLFDEIAFLLLFALLAIFYSNSSQPATSSDKSLNKFYLSASFSYKILIFYLIFSLFYGLQVDLYFGKIRWLIILTALLFYDYFAYCYLRNKIYHEQQNLFVRQFYNYGYFFCLFYLLYGLLAQLAFGISPNFIQAAQVEAPYAIWGTTAYVAIIFLPLLLYNRVLFTSGKITKLRFLSAYLICVSVMLFFDARTLAVILILFLCVEFLMMKFSYKIFSIILLTPVAILFISFAGNFINDLLSSGGFLLSFVDESSAEETLRDFDRVAHYIAAYEVLTSSNIYVFFGSGFLNAGTVMQEAYFNVYHQFGVTPANLKANTAGATQVSTFGLSAFLVENGLVGLALLIYHFFNLMRAAIKTKLIMPSLYLVIIYPLLFLLLFSIYLNDNMYFYLLLSPATIIYPLTHKSKPSTII